MNNKKVMLINWPLLDVGGITTWADQITKGFEGIGWQADHYYCTRTGRISVSETEKTPIGRKHKRGEKVKSKALGFAGESNIAYYKKLLNEYDYVIFIHASPHPTKGNLAQKNIEDWKKLYTECDKPKVVIFHDKKWHITNKWFVEVRDHVDVCLAAQHNFIESVKDYVDLNGPKIVYDWLYFPLEIPVKDFMALSREESFCMMPQWIKWKNHHLLLEEAHEVKYPIHFYNGGMQYHYLVKTDAWQKSICKDHVEDKIVNSEALHQYHGFVTYKDVITAYRTHEASIDLTTRTYQNYTHHEGMLHGCILCCTNECRQGHYNHIPGGHCWIIDMSDIAGSLNRLMNPSNKNNRDDMRNKAYDHVAQHFDCKNIAKKINDIVASLQK